jgi:hypothetical protein
MSHFALNPFFDPQDALVFREWYVSVDGGETVGPVSADQIARGIRGGQVPSHAQMTRFDQSIWEDVASSSAVVAALRAL